MAEEAKTLAYSVDKYKCAKVEPAALPESPEAFGALLQATVEKFGAEGVRGFWLRIPGALSQLIPVAMKAPFALQLHHTDGQELTLSKWLAPGPCKFPVYCTHLLGAGGLVFNTKTDKLLLMQEHWMENPAWKVSGGQVDAGEWIEHAAVREVREETGVVCEAVGVLAHRELLRFRWNRADIYYVVLCLTEQEEISIDETEASKAQWFTVEEVLHPDFKKSLTFNQVALTLAAAAQKHPGAKLWQVLRDHYVERGVHLTAKNAQAGTSAGVYRHPKI